MRWAGSRYALQCTLSLRCAESFNTLERSGFSATSIPSAHAYAITQIYRSPRLRLRPLRSKAYGSLLVSGPVKQCRSRYGGRATIARRLRSMIEASSGCRCSASAKSLDWKLRDDLPTDYHEYYGEARPTGLARLIERVKGAFS